jgi:hypothetical protein
MWKTIETADLLNHIMCSTCKEDDQVHGYIPNQTYSLIGVFDVDDMHSKGSRI